MNNIYVIYYSQNRSIFVEIELFVIVSTLLIIIIFKHFSMVITPGTISKFTFFKQTKMENKPVPNKTRKQSKTVLDKVKRTIDTEVAEDSPFEEESVLADSSPPKKQKKLPISTILEIAKLINSPENLNKTVSLDATNDEETHKVPHGTEPALDSHKGPVQVTTINLLSTIQHPVDFRKVEQLVSQYEQQQTNGAKLRPIASF